MESMGQRATLFDAGLDFYRRFLLDTDQLIQTMALLKSRLSNGELEPAVEKKSDTEPFIVPREHEWRQWLDQTPAVIARLQSEAFFDPMQAAQDFQHLDRLLALVSAAYYPASFSRSGFQHPGLNHPDDVRGFVNNAQLNPFQQYGLAATLQPAGSPKPDLTIILVARQGQVAPAASLLAAWARRWPEMAVTAAGDPSWVQAVHVAAGIPRPVHPGQERTQLWETFQERWVQGAETMAVAETGPAGPYLMPPGQRPDVATHPLHADAMAQIIASTHRRTNGTIVWEDPQGELKAITGHLFEAARQGGWNHLVLGEDTDHPIVKGLMDFSCANPNIVHSWCLRGRASSRYSDPLDRLPRGSARYGQTAPLPGVPLWQVLRDPVYIAAYQEHLGTRTLMQLRLDAADLRIYEIGRQMTYHFVKPAELPEGYLDEICRMVEAGGSVGTQWLRHNLERAFLIAYVLESGVIVGNSSLKHPRQEYIEAVSAQSGLDLRNYLERGYTSVRPEYRGFGIGAKLLEGLTERADGYKIFSIIGEDNIGTQKMAIRNRTRKVATFMSGKVQKQVGVWIPEWMLPEGIVLPPQPGFEDGKNK